MSQNSFLGTDSLPAIVPTNDEKTLGLLAHVLTFVASFLAPLIIYLIKKDQSEFVADHAKESLNFQITLFLAVMVCIPLSIILIGIPALILIGLLSLVLRIVATIKASEGKIYRYPFCLRLIK